MVQKPVTKVNRNRGILLLAGLLSLTILSLICAGATQGAGGDEGGFVINLPLVLGRPVAPEPTPDSSPAPAAACLSRSGPRITIDGTNPVTDEDRYALTDLPDHTIIDATRAEWLDPTSNFPVDLIGVDHGEGGSCLSGGRITGGYDPDTTSWSRYHSSAGFGFRVGNFLWENTYVENFGDGVRIANKQDENTCQVLQDANHFTVRGVYMKDMHDDCVENDWSRAGVIEDSLFEGCYTGFSTRAGNRCAAELTDSTRNVVTITNSLIWMKPVPTILETGTVVGNSELFKDEAGSSEWTLYNNVIRADDFPIGESYEKCMGLNGGDGNCVGYGVRRYPGSPLGDPNSKLARCGNNVFVWLGEGDYPPPYNDSGWRIPLQNLRDPVTDQPCFTFTKDVSVWDEAVQEWKARHGYR